MHAKDLIYMAYFDPHRVFDGLTSYIHSMRRRHQLTYYVVGGGLLTPRHWAAALSTCTTGGSSDACACCLTIASICLHAITAAVGRRPYMAAAAAVRSYHL